MRTSTIRVDYLARVEGEGSLLVKIKDHKVSDIAFKIFEPPRFFEAFLRGRHFMEVPDITARICGICPVAYQMSSSIALEDACDVTVDGPLRELRRLLYCGEWIQSHALHIYLLHAPDFLGYESALHMAKDHAEIVKRGLAIKKIGNELMTLIGGRDIHPIAGRVGGFYCIPDKETLNAFRERLQWALEASAETVRMTAKFDFPEFESDYEFVALHREDEYAVLDGRLISNRGLDIPIYEYDQHFEESHEMRSNALHSIHKGYGAYFVGPLARFNLNFKQLAPSVRELAKEVGFTPPCLNPFKSIVVRSLEMMQACRDALAIVDRYEPAVKPFVAVRPRRSTGYGCTEAPRGICYHRYQMDDDGLITDAKIVPPTSQNQKQIEDDLKRFVEAHAELPKDKLTWQCEQAIRNYDPCISCATHFLKLDIQNDL